MPYLQRHELISYDAEIGLSGMTKRGTKRLGIVR
jgi:hypothetical protein